MANYREITIETKEDTEGVITSTSVEKSTKITKNDEPDYIKLYTKMWAEFAGVPEAYRELFLQLAIRMTYCNADDLEHAQLVSVGKPFGQEIMKVLKWKENMFRKGMQGLVKCNAIRRVSRGVYQINPSYAGKGEWKYNPKLERGGVENLIATFNYKEKSVDTKIIWADNGQSNDFNNIYREGLDVNEADKTVLTHTLIMPVSP